MKKHILRILLLAFLFIGVSISVAHEEDVPGFRETIEISVGSIAQSDMAFSLIPVEKSSLGILTAFSLPRNVAPVRILKFNDIPVIIQLLSSRSFRLPEDRRKTLFADTDSLKYADRYYIYTLGHILI